MKLCLKWHHKYAIFTRYYDTGGVIIDQHYKEGIASSTKVVRNLNKMKRNINEVWS